jgi:HPt (histidine-containing phosphotransfer) domain-containing protein
MSNTPETEIQTLLRDIWKRHLPQLLERLTLLEQTAGLAASSTLSEEQRVEAQNVAHKLAGNLGMFGYELAGNTASQIEQTLKTPTPETLTQLPTLVATLKESLAQHLTTDNEQPATNNLQRTTT